MLFSEIAKMYLADKRDGRKAVRANTLEGYTSAVTNHLLPRWGQVEVETISYDDVQSWVDSFPDGRGAEKAYKTLRQMLRWAISHRIVTMADPTIGVEVPKPRRRESVTLSDSQLNRMLYACRDEVWEAVVWCQACLGLRRCEAVALTWGDIDLRSGVVHVNKDSFYIELTVTNGDQLRLHVTQTDSVQAVAYQKNGVEKWRITP